MKQISAFASQALNSQVVVTTVHPDNNKSLKAVLILLHGSIFPEGSYSLYERFPDELNLQELCDEYQLMIVMPFITKNCYYISQAGLDFDCFVADELPDMIHEKYPLTRKLEIMLGGISMGAYGAALIGAHTGCFEKIICVSGAFIQDDILIGNPQIWGKSVPGRIRKEESFLNHFMPLSDLGDAIDRNAVAALSSLAENTTGIRFAVSCGTDDMLYSRNEKLIGKLKEKQILYRFFPVKDGKHDSDCFRKGIEACIECFMNDNKMET